MSKQPLLPEKLRAQGPNVLALAAGLWYAVQAWGFAHTQASVLDEGLYLVKGWLFASGQYTPFQDYGVWSNHMPLSFLIPGYAQALFGAGLRTGRMFAVVLGLLSLLGVWILAKRFADTPQPISPIQKWLPALITWAVAVNPAIIKIFSVQASQGLAACILIWALVGILGSDRPAWQVWAGAILLGALPLTRLNLLPVLPLGIGYIYWEHGERRGVQSLLLGAAVFAGLHAIYWPNILRMWAGYFPQELTPFLDTFRRAPGALPSWTPSMPFSSRVQSFWQGVRYHFIALTGILGLLLFWPKSWPSTNRKAALFLLINFGVLLALHAWASLGQNYCVFCFIPYLSFFSLTGLIILAVSLPYWNFTASRKWAVIILILLITLGIGYSTADTLGYNLLQEPTVARWMKIEVPRTSGEGTIPLWGLIENRLGWEFETSVKQTFYWTRTGLTTLLGGLAGVLVLLLARRPSQLPSGSAARAWVYLVVGGLILSPTAVLGGGYRTYDCGGDVIAAYEAAGQSLRDQIPERVYIYWEGDSPVPLLYLPGTSIYPPQLNGTYSFKIGGEADALVKFGHWNQALAEQWAAQADVVLIDGASLKDSEHAWLLSIIQSDAFDSLPATEPVHPCEPDSRIHLFVRQSTP